MAADAYLYPDEFATPGEKSEASYGLDYVRAMYYSSSRHGSRLFDYNSEFDTLVEFAQGRQSVDDIKKLFGWNPNPNNPQFDGPESLMYLDPKVLNLVPKYINRAVAKMQRLNYDITLSAVDINSIDKAKDLESAIKAYYRMKPWMDKVELNAQEFFPELDIASMPKYQDEMMFNATVNPKIRMMVNGEKIMKLVHSINNMREKLRQVCWDIVVLGRGHFHCFHDQNLVPRINRINPKYWMGSYVDNEDYNSQENAGFIDFITIGQFKKEARGTLDDKTIREIADHYANVNTVTNSSFTHPNNFDGLRYIPVLRFYYLSNDCRNFRIQKNIHGNTAVHAIDKRRDQIELTEINTETGKQYRMVETEYTSCYGGTWILDSDVVYNYGRKEYPRTDLVNLSLPIKTFAPNMKEGRVVSFAAQLIEPAFMVNVSWNKIKEILAKGWMGVREVDFTQLEKVSLGRAGREWSPRDVWEYFLMSNTLVKRGKVNQYDQSMGEAVREVAGGLTLADYFTTFTNGIRIMESQTGSSLVEQFDQPDRLAVGVMEASANTGDIDMEWLYNAHDEIYEQASHQMLLLAQESRRQGIRLGNTIPVLGGAEWFEFPEDDAYTQYGLMIRRLHNEAQLWGEFYLDVREALRAGQITLSDSAYLRSISNLKEAQQMLAIRHEMYAKRNAEVEGMNQKAALEANAQAAEMKTEGKLQEIGQQGKIDMEIEKLKGQIQERLAAIDRGIENQAKQYTDQMKMMSKKQEGMDRMLQQGMRNNTELKVQQMQESTQMAKIASDERTAEKKADKPAS